MNKGAKGISYTHLVKNNKVPLVLGDFVIVGKISIKEVKTHLLWIKPRHLTKEGLPPRITCMQAMSLIQGKQPRRLRGRHMDTTRIEGSTGRQTASNSCGHQAPTQGPTGKHLEKAHPDWAHRGSADPTGRPNWPCGCHSGASTWCFLVGSWSTSGVLTPFS
jgi:hypothetical protein